MTQLGGRLLLSDERELLLHLARRDAAFGQLLRRGDVLHLRRTELVLGLRDDGHQVLALHHRRDARAGAPGLDRAVAIHLAVVDERARAGRLGDFAAPRGDRFALLVDRLLEVVEFLFGAREGLLLRGEGFRKEMGLLAERLGLHPHLFELLVRRRNLGLVTRDVRAVFLDTRRIDADHLAAALVRALGLGLLGGELLETVLKGVNLRVEVLRRLLGLGDGLLRLGDCLVDLVAVDRVLLEFLIEGVDLLLRNVNVEPLELVAEFLVLLSLADLALEGCDLPLHFAEDVRLAEKVLLGLLNLAQGLLAIHLELRDAGGLFEDRAAVFGLGRENRVDLALGHHRVGACADTRAHEEMLDIFEAALLLVDEILARAVAIDAAGDRHLMIVGAQFLLAVRKRNRHFRRAEGLARVGSVEDDIR